MAAIDEVKGPRTRPSFTARSASSKRFFSATFLGRVDGPGESAFQPLGSV